MKRKGRLRGAIFSLAVCTGIFCAWCCVLLMVGEYNSARHKLNVHKEEVQAWEACRQTRPSYFRENSEAVSSSLKNYNEARNNPWMSLPKERLIGIFVLAALGSAVVGSLVSWIVLSIVCLVIYRFVRGLVLCFRVVLHST
jgi:Flp pilus assembly protein TadB